MDHCRFRVEARAATVLAKTQFSAEWHEAYEDDDLDELRATLEYNRETWLDYRIVDMTDGRVLFDWPSDGEP